MTSAVPNLEKVKNAFDYKLRFLKSFPTHVKHHKVIRECRAVGLNVSLKTLLCLKLHVCAVVEIKHPYRGLNRENLLLCSKSPSRM